MQLNPFNPSCQVACHQCWTTRDPKGKIISCQGCKARFRTSRIPPNLMGTNAPFCKKCSLVPRARLTKKPDYQLGFCYGSCCGGKPLHPAVGVKATTKKPSVFDEMHLSAQQAQMAQMANHATVHPSYIGNIWSGDVVLAPPTEEP